MIKIFSDSHHIDLYYSLHLLFEKRLGWDLYCPVGIEWYNDGYWKVYEHPDTALQYLGIVHDSVKLDDGIYNIDSYKREKQYKKGIILEKFKQTRFDIVVSSIPIHFSLYEKLIKEYQPQAKHVFQMGNNWLVPDGVKNLLNSTNVVPDRNINHCKYHQEFDLNEFCYTDCCNPKIITNLLHYMPNDVSFLFHELEDNMLDFVFKAYGAGNRDLQMDDIPRALKDTGFLWHVKKEGDGYGYNIHRAYACGRPVITVLSDYKGMTAEVLMEDCVTCIDIDNKSFEEIVRIIRDCAKPENYLKMCTASYDRFKNNVDFDKEFEDIKKFLENAI